MALTGNHSPGDLGHPADHNLIDNELARLEIDKLDAAALEPALADYVGTTDTAYDSARLGGVNALLYQTAAQASSAYAPITGSASYLSEVYLPAGALAPAGGAPSLSAVAGYFPCWLLDSATTEAVTATAVRVPDGWTQVMIDAYFINPNASTGNHVTRLIIGAHSVGSVVSAAADGPYAIASGAQSVLTRGTFPGGGASIAVTPGQMLMLGVERIGGDASDSLAGDIGVAALVIRKAP